MDNLLKRDEDFKGVVFSLGSEQFGVDVRDVREVLELKEISPVPKTPAFVEGILSLRGHIIGVVDLRKFFDLKTIESGKDTRIMIVRIKGVLAGLIVDSVDEVASIHCSAIEQTPKLVSSQIGNNFLQGVAKIDNRMIFILNLESVLSEKELKHLIKVRSSVK